MHYKTTTFCIYFRKVQQNRSNNSFPFSVGVKVLETFLWVKSPVGWRCESKAFLKGSEGHGSGASWGMCEGVFRVTLFQRAGGRGQRGRHRVKGSALSFRTREQNKHGMSRLDGHAELGALRCDSDNETKLQSVSLTELVLNFLNLRLVCRNWMSFTDWPIAWQNDYKQDTQILAKDRCVFTRIKAPLCPRSPTHTFLLFLCNALLANAMFQQFTQITGGNVGLNG